MALSNQIPATNFTLTLGRDSCGAPFPTKWSLNEDGKNLQRPPNIRFSVLLGGQHHDSETMMKCWFFQANDWGSSHTQPPPPSPSPSPSPPTTHKRLHLKVLHSTMPEIPFTDWLLTGSLYVDSSWWNNHPYITGYHFIPEIQQMTKVLFTAHFKMIKLKNGKKRELMSLYRVKIDFISMD